MTGTTGTFLLIPFGGSTIDLSPALNLGESLVGVGAVDVNSLSHQLVADFDIKERGGKSNFLQLFAGMVE
jgi:hypothetical protein